jgi:leader peptidase (prepilin peptidase)/N-methyltransferase
MFNDAQMVMVVLYGVIGGLFGLMFGSAINAIVWRLYVGRSWAKGRSVCPDCGHTLAAVDLVPVVSWMVLRGKCRYCRAPIKDNPVAELVTAGAFAVSVAVILPISSLDFVKLGFWLVLLVLLLILAVYDARWLILPDKIIAPLVVVALMYSTTMAWLTHSPQVLLGSLEAAAIAGGFFWLLVAGTKGRAMGGGDVKLAFAMGLILGAQGTAVGLLVAFNTAALVGVVLIVSKLKGRKDQIPFGPYLVGGTVVAFLSTRTIVDWYLRLNGL